MGRGIVPEKNLAVGVVPLCCDMGVFLKHGHELVAGIIDALSGSGAYGGDRFFGLFKWICFKFQQSKLPYVQEENNKSLIIYQTQAVI
jgi:hypothetical protein